MQTLDPAGEWLRLSEHYRHLSDDELVDLACQTSDLTDIAQQVLAQEIAHRGLKIPSKEPPMPPLRPQSRPEWLPDSVADAESPYADDRELVTICKVWSLADALKLQRLLDTAGIPFYIGPENATGVDPVTLNFANGLSVQIMRIGLPWAYRACQEYFPADEPPEEKTVGPDNVAIHCPKCRSTEVVFENLNSEPKNSEGEPSSKFKWTCDSCGHEWEDDGLLTEN
jgi:DNA-directed RNA polymerase subunit M/transcription elongation factor TFIIS